MENRKKKSGGLKLRHVGFILGAIAYIFWRLDSFSRRETDEDEAEFGGFDDYY